jgi:glycosyltransferase involved in cell wall biosynthesis
MLRHPRVKQLALSVLARSPALHARAMAIMFPPSRLIDLDATPAVTMAPRAPRPGRPRVAFVSPLPPARTGIADYAAQLLPALLAYADIDLIVQQDVVTLPPALAHLPLRDPAWLRANAHEFDHIVYQVGNSEFHSHMFALLRDLPGVVVLHDFFLGNVMAYRQMRHDPPGAWTGALFHSHGYPALRDWQTARDRTALFKAWPCNLAVLQQASVVIHHSSHAAALARTWYGQEATRHWHSVPLPRAAPLLQDRAGARAALGIAADVFLVCSFGHIVPNKLGDRLLATWLASTLHTCGRCLLVLVGACQDSPYGANVARLAASSQGTVQIAGWSDDTVYHRYLQAADLAVQLRTSAQGETSAAVLDCMNYGLATIVNANGSMAGLPDDTVMRLADDFDDAALTGALEALHDDAASRAAIGARAAQLLASAYRPEHGAALYMAALHAEAARNTLHVRQLLVDIGDCLPEQRDLLRALLQVTDIRVELVRLVQEDGQWRLRYARAYAGDLLGMTWAVPDDPVAYPVASDIVYLPAHTAATAEAFLLWQELRSGGVALAIPPGAAAYNSGC